MDLLVTTGGTAAGDHDLVTGLPGPGAPPLEALPVAMRPGRTLLVGRTGDGVPVLGLPGSPIACMVSAFVFMAPALRALLGLAPEQPVPAVAGADLPAVDSRREYTPAVLSGAGAALTATPIPRREAGTLAGFARADGLIVRPAGAGAVRAGDTVEVISFTDCRA